MSPYLTANIDARLAREERERLAEEKRRKETESQPGYQRLLAIVRAYDKVRDRHCLGGAPVLRRSPDGLHMVCDASQYSCAPVIVAADWASVLVAVDERLALVQR